MCVASTYFVLTFVVTVLGTYSCSTQLNSINLYYSNCQTAVTVTI